MDENEKRERYNEYEKALERLADVQEDYKLGKLRLQEDRVQAYREADDERSEALLRDCDKRLHELHRHYVGALASARYDCEYALRRWEEVEGK